MPIYEFECHSCGARFETLVLPWIAESVEKGTAPECPTCHATDVARMISECGINSEETRQASLAKARKKNRAVQREKQDAEYKEMLEHANEHH
jgi:putative FmdB family regulatory protein